MALEEFQKIGRTIWDNLDKQSQVAVAKLTNDRNAITDAALHDQKTKWKTIHKTNQRKLFAAMKEFGLI